MQKHVLNPAYATTRSLFKNVPEVEQKIASALSTNTLWGGLRKKGFFKVSTPDKPLITVITVVYNGKKILEETIRSVIEQTYDNVEYLIIDGHSTDGTLDIVQTYDQQIDFWLSEPDKSLYDAMNKGIFWFGNTIVAFLNADDVYIQNNVLEHIAQCFIDQPEMQIIYGKIQADFEAEGCILLFGKKYSTKDLKKGHCLPHPATFMRKEILSAQGGFDLQYKTASDYDLICKCFLNQSSSRFFTDRIITRFRLGGKSATPETDVEKARIIRKHFGWIPYTIYTSSKSLSSIRQQILIFSGLRHLWRKVNKLKKVRIIQGD